MSIDPLNPPLLTAEIPGIGGRIKTEPQDFEVEEIPAYDLSGTGEHLYLWVEKTGLGADFFHRRIARQLGIPSGDVGVAGLKDRHAVTRQWVSVPANCEPLVPSLDGDGVRILNVTRHDNKLKLGHLRGNRFHILIRDADPSRTEELNRILSRVRDEGLPNYYGPQRFGRDGETVTMGMSLLKGESKRRPNPFLYKLALSAAQSLLFNHALGARLNEGLLRKVLPGDAMMKWPFGGIFTAEEITTDQSRLDRREIIPGGPIFGKKMFPAHSIALDRESHILEQHGLTREHFGAHGKLLAGTRRYNFIYLEDLESTWIPEGLRLRFSMPSGCYATVLLREAMKLAVTGEEEL